jgi:type II secretory pathway pseudopilin PulG
MRNSAVNRRRGITLLEVLISIGILAVGLTSVVALVPAGRSNATQALMYDRALTLAENALDDAVTFGCLKMRTLGIATGTSTSTIVLDDAPTASALGATPGSLARLGIYTSSTADSANAAPAAVARQFLQLRDDVVVQPGQGEDDLPRYRTIDGVRGFEGRFTCMLAISPIGSLMSAGSPARLTAVVFHNRDISTPVVEAFWDPDGALVFTPPADRTVRQTFHTGSVFVTSGRFYRARSVSYDSTGRAHVLCSEPGFAPTTRAYILIDSIGIAERFVTLEGGGPYSQ